MAVPVCWTSAASSNGLAAAGAWVICFQTQSVLNVNFHKGQKQICVVKVGGNRSGPNVAASKTGDEQLNLIDLDVFWMSAQSRSKSPTYSFNILSIQCSFVPLKPLDVHRIDISTRSLAVSACSCCLWWLAELWTLKQMVFLPLLRILFTFAFWGQSEGAELCL